jgi:hypothetical protein
MIHGDMDVNTTKQEVALNVLVVNCQDTSERGAMIWMKAPVPVVMQEHLDLLKAFFNRFVSRVLRGNIRHWVEKRHVWNARIAVLASIFCQPMLVKKHKIEFVLSYLREIIRMRIINIFTSSVQQVQMHQRGAQAYKTVCATPAFRDQMGARVLSVAVESISLQQGQMPAPTVG